MTHCSNIIRELYCARFLNKLATHDKGMAFLHDKTYFEKITEQS